MCLTRFTVVELRSARDAKFPLALATTEDRSIADLTRAAVGSETPVEIRKRGKCYLRSSRISIDPPIKGIVRTLSCRSRYLWNELAKEDMRRGHVYRRFVCSRSSKSLDVLRLQSVGTLRAGDLVYRSTFDTRLQPLVPALSARLSCVVAA